VRKWSFLVFAVLSCALPVDIGSNRSEQVVQPSSRCEFSGPKEQVIPLQLDQAACVGVTAQACAGCHRLTGKDCFELRPQRVPTHPAGLTTPIPDLCRLNIPRDAGVDAGMPCQYTGTPSEVIPLTLSQAECVGLTSRIHCKACHQPSSESCWELRPRGGNPPPTNHFEPTAGCGIPGFGDAGQ
jgi:hypothetical protein